MGPSVSVVVPTFRRPDQVRRLVETLLGQLAADDEVVVVDDGSGDSTVGTLRALSDPRLRVVSQPNAGPATARNRGVSEAHNPVVLFVDDDEVPEPGFVDAHRRAHQGSRPRVVVGRPRLVVPHRRGERTVDEQPDGRFLVIGASCSLPRGDFVRVGGFDTSLRGGEDVDLGLRLAAAGLGIDVAPDARIRHRIDRSYARFRRDRRERGEGSALLRRKHGIGLLPDRTELGRADRWLIRVTAPAPVREVVAAGLWALVRAAGLAGSWRAQSVLARRVGLIHGLAVERRTLEHGASAVSAATGSPLPPPARP